MSARASGTHGRGIDLSTISVPRISGDLVATLVSALVALEIGATVTTSRMDALLPVAALGGLLLLVDHRARILFLVFGGLLTLQSSSTLGSLKLVYLAGICVSFAGATFRLSTTEERFNRRLAAPLLRVSVAMIVLIVISFFVAQAQGTHHKDWLRDVAPYVLFAFAPIFALDASAMSRRALKRLLVIAGMVATAAFATHWLQARQIAQLPFSSLGLSSFYFPAALFVYAIASALHVNRRRLLWGALGIAVFTLLIATGTRTTLILALAPIAAVMSARRYAGSRFIRLAIAGPIALVLMAGGAYGVILATHASTTIITKRISILKHTGTSSDASYLDRQAQTHAAAKIFDANPVFGAGPGKYFKWIQTDGKRFSTLVLDSPVDFPAKFGLMGLAVIGFLVLNYASFVRASFRFNHPRPETLALAGYAVVAVAGSVLATPLEDKGLTLGLILLLALLFRTVDQSATTPGSVLAPQSAT